MKRFRAVQSEIDSRASLLALEIRESWEPDVKDMHLNNREKMLRSLIDEYGALNAQATIQNLIDLGNAPFSIISYHNEFFRQVRSAFVMEAYYPAVTGACALGERVLNHLLLTLRDFYRATPQYKKVYRTNSFANWNLVIDTLEAWNVLLPEAVRGYRRLARIRNQAIHFNAETDQNPRGIALRSIQTLSAILETQFTAFGIRTWFISGTPGVSFIKKEAELNPFVRAFYLPNCALVGPFHTLEFQPSPDGSTVIVHDTYAYSEKEISDDEFKAMYLAEH